MRSRELITRSEVQPLPDPGGLPPSGLGLELGLAASTAVVKPMIAIRAIKNFMMTVFVGKCRVLESTVWDSEDC